MDNELLEKKWKEYPTSYRPQRFLNGNTSNFVGKNTPLSTNNERQPVVPEPVIVPEEKRPNINKD